MGGFFGVVADHDCVCDLFYGTDYHSHLGTKRGGLAVCDREGRITRRIHDITNAQFRSKFDDDIDKFIAAPGSASSATTKTSRSSFRANSAISRS